MNNEVITKVVENTNWIAVVMPYFLSAVVIAFGVVVISGIVKDWQRQ